MQKLRFSFALESGVFACFTQKAIHHFALDFDVVSHTILGGESTIIRGGNAVELRGRLTYEPIGERDIPVLTPIMKRAFDEDSQMHLGKDGGPDGYDDGAFLRKYALHPDSTARKILLDGRPAGAYILWLDPPTRCHMLGNLFVDPSVGGKGVGTAAWAHIEREYPGTALWRTETPIFSRRNHHFYVNKCGFHVVRIENPHDPENGSYILEKRMNR